MNEELINAIRQAIRDSENDSGLPEELLTLQATAAAAVIEQGGYFFAAGTEYGVRRGDVIEEHGFNTEYQATTWAKNHLAQGAYLIEHRPVGVWQK